MSCVQDVVKAKSYILTGLLPTKDITDYFALKATVAKPASIKPLQFSTL